MWVKVCGITNLDDAQRAIELGADALGFNFYPPSPRYISPSESTRIINRLPLQVLMVGVFVGFPTGPICEELRALQLHGLHSESEIKASTRRVFVATSPTRIDDFPNYEIVIDTSWGSGKKADWKGLREVCRPFILSGGLTPENVGEAIQELHPAGVDVCSGVESAPGRKDPHRLKRFLEAVRQAASGIQG
ncbi:MAG: N-(5'-phosphoribosyl)anthranilate isomerase [Acidobacteriota bacterium]